MRCRGNCDTVFFCLRFFKNVLAQAAKRTYPIFGKSLERCAGLDSVIGVSELGIVYITASTTFVFIHFDNLLFVSNIIIPLFAKKKRYFIKKVIKIFDKRCDACYNAIAGET